MRQGEFLDKDAYSHLSYASLWAFRTATADADEVHVRLPKQKPTAQMHFASDLPLSQGSHSINGQEMTKQASPR